MDRRGSGDGSHREGLWLVWCLRGRRMPWCRGVELMIDDVLGVGRPEA